MVRTSLSWGPVAVFWFCISGGVSLKVTRPAETDNFIADRTHTVEWTGTDKGLFYIDLYYCGSSCSDTYCGDFVAALCPEDPEGCPDGAGDYDVLFPEPLGGLTSNGYVVRVEDAEDPDNADCSDPFRLVASPEAPVVGDVDGPVLEVLLPVEEDRVNAGEEYTLKFIYDDGFGSSHGRFAFNLYEVDESDGTWSCGSGTPLFDLCDKPHVGCRDRAGDYEVTVPSSVETGTYVIEIALFGSDSLANCSEPFRISGEESSQGESTMSSSVQALTPAPTGSPSLTAPSDTSPPPTQRPPRLVSNGGDEGCSVINVNAMPGYESDYTGTYTSLGVAGDRSRFVRGDNAAVLQYAVFKGEGYWLLTGLGTTFSVLSDAEHPTDITCSASEACWEEDTPTGPVEAFVELSCDLDTSTMIADYFYTDATPSPVAFEESSSSRGPPLCSTIDLESGDEAFSNYSGVYTELGVSGGLPRFVREDNAAVLQRAAFDGVVFWLLSGLATTLSVASEARHPTEIACLGKRVCWKEETPSFEVNVEVNLACVAEE